MRIVLISTPIGFLGSGKGGGVELTINSLVYGLLHLGHSVEVIAPNNSKLYERNQKQFFRWFSDVYYNNAKLPLDEELEAISCSILRRWLDTSEYVDSTKVISMM